jgi:F-type H+-transporting ATPase subunit a
MVFRLPRIKSLCQALCIFGMFLFLMPLTLSALENQTDTNTFHSGQAEKTTKEFNAGEMIIEHITDAHEWHIATYGHTHISIPLPVILLSDGGMHIFSSARFHHGEGSYDGFKLETEGKNKGKIVKVLADGITPDDTAALPMDFSISKNVMSLFISVALLMIIFISISRSYTRRKDHAPKGLQSLIEPLIMFIRDDIARPSIGEKRYIRYMPFLLTLFFFIFLNNLMGLVPFFPGGANLTGNIAVTMVLALFTFIITSFSGNKDYWKHIVNAPGVPWWLKFPVPLMPIVEIVGVITKPFVLMVRLFANMTAGHIIVLGFMSLIFIFGKMNVGIGLSVTPVSVGFSVFMGLLELLVAFIQAYVFTLLSAIYFGMATEEHAH